jgi:hypothetical protein
MTPRSSAVDSRRILLGFLPLGVLLVVAIAAPGAWDAITANPPAIAALPLGMVLVGVGLSLMLLGVVALRAASSRPSMMLAFVGLTLPSIILMIVAPTLVLLIQTMDT